MKMSDVEVKEQQTEESYKTAIYNMMDTLNKNSLERLYKLAFHLYKNQAD